MYELNQVFINENCDVTKDFASDLDKILAKKVCSSAFNYESKAF